MTASEVFAMFAGIAVVIASIGVAVYLINKGSTPQSLYIDSKEGAKPDAFFSELDKRMGRRGFTQGSSPLWSYEEKTTTTTYPRETKPTTGKRGAQPKTDPGPKPQAHRPESKIQTDPPTGNPGSPKET